MADLEPISYINQILQANYLLEIKTKGDYTAIVAKKKTNKTNQIGYTVKRLTLRSFVLVLKSILGKIEAK